MKCTKCGQQVDRSDAFCGYCGTPAEAESSNGGIVLERSPMTGSPAAGVPVTAIPAGRQPLQAFQQVVPPSAGGGPRPPMFRLAHDETVLKTYETVQLRTGLFKRKRGQGTLYVTDARLVFYAWVNPRGTQRASWLLQQTKLEDISGLDVNVSRRISVGLLMLSFIFGLATIGMLLTVVLIPVAFFFAILTVICLIALARDASKRGSIGLSVHSRGNQASPINIGNSGRTGFLGIVVRLFMWPVLIFVPSYSALDVVAGDPAEDATQLVHELGALIIDLQTRGTMAYEHWGIGLDAEPVRAAGAL
jgi:hypothetical protein